MSAKKFSLIEAFVPVIKGKELVKDPGMGGIKLTYQETSTKVTLTKKDKKTRVFLKPFKSTIAEDKKDCEVTYGKGSWGNTSSLLSNVWLEVVDDYKNFDDSCNFIWHNTVTDNDLIKQLNNQTKEFVLGVEEPITKLPLTERARLFWDQLRNK